MDDARVKKYIKLYDKLKAKRVNWENMWEEVAKYCDPNSSDSFTDAPSTLDGERKTFYNMTSAPINAATRGASVLYSLLTPHSARWHTLVAATREERESLEVRRYLDDVLDELYFQRYQATADFNRNIQAVWFSSVLYGTGVMYVDGAPEGGLRYRAIHLSETYLDKDFAGNVSTVIRRFKLSAEEAVEMFGDGLPEKIVKDAEAGREGERVFIHVVRPRSGRNPAAKTQMNMPFESVYICLDEKMIIREGGYKTFPYLVVRYQVAAGETYGRSPAINLLPSIKMLNQIEHDRLNVCNRLGNPTYLAHDDDVIQAKALLPGKVAFGGLSPAGQKLVQPLDVPSGELPHIENAIEAHMRMIADAFLLTLFQILTDTPTMSATEALERAREKAFLMSPTGGVFQGQPLGLFVERELDLLNSQKRLPALPMGYNEIEMLPEFTSPLNKAERAGEAAGVLRTIESLLAVVNATQDMSVLDVFDTVKTARFLADANSVPANIMSTDEEIEAKKASRNEQATVQQAIQAAPAVSALLKR